MPSEVILWFPSSEQTTTTQTNKKLYKKNFQLHKIRQRNTTLYGISANLTNFTYLL